MLMLRSPEPLSERGRDCSGAATGSAADGGRNFLQFTRMAHPVA